MLLSKSCVYGLRASLFLATKRKGGYISIREVSEKLEISFHFLTKILQTLNGTGLIESHKGPRGGVRLAKDGADITLFEIVEAIDGRDLFSECALGLPGCGNQKPCPMHENWAEVRGTIRKMLEETTIVEMAQKGKRMNLRITNDGTYRWA